MSRQVKDDGKGKTYYKVSVYNRRKNTPPIFIFKTKLQGDVENYLSWFHNLGCDEYWFDYPTEEDLKKEFVIVPRVEHEGQKICG